MKRAKDKYMINRTKYKDIKRYDHQQMEDLQDKEEEEWRTIKFTTTQMHTWKAT